MAELTREEIAKWIGDNGVDALMYEVLGTDVATARAALSLAQDFSRPEWRDVHKTSMSLSGRVSRYVGARMNSDSWLNHARPGICLGECDQHGV